MTSFPRRRFFGLFPAAATSLVLGKETVAVAADPIPVMPIQSLVMGNQGPIEVVRSLFPKGFPITQENVKLLIDNGWAINSLISCHLPITGEFSSEGDQYWYRDGQLHRADGPAVTYADGSQKWYMDDKIHRDGGPAITYADGYQAWYRDGEYHRDGGPALTWSDGSQFWYRDGMLHRDDGPAVTRADGSQEWFRDGKIHREGGPALTCADGSQVWFRDGERHRDGGPAIIRADGYQFLVPGRQAPPRGPRHHPC